MEFGTRRHLAQLLAKARGGPFLGGWMQWSVETYAEFMAALGALLAAEAVTLQEASDFQNRMLAILGHEPVYPAANAPRLPYVWLGEHSSWVESPSPVLVEVHELDGSESDTPWGARFKVGRLERYEDRAILHWTLDRWDHRERFDGAMEDHGRDTDGLPEAVRAALREEAVSYLERSLHHFRLVDNIGTMYLPKRRTMSGNIGESTYHPGIPDSAKRLVIEWYGWSTVIYIR